MIIAEDEGLREEQQHARATFSSSHCVPFIWVVSFALGGSPHSSHSYPIAFQVKPFQRVTMRKSSCGDLIIGAYNQKSFNATSMM